MTHSTVLVVLPRQPTSDDDLGDMLVELLAPFDENTQVERYRDYVDPCPETWRETLEHQERFQKLQEGGIERKAAWEMVWGEKNDDAHVPYPRSSAMRDGVDPSDDAAVAAWFAATYPTEDDTDERYYVDDSGLYSWSTYNPLSRWDWYTLGGRWTGFFPRRADADLDRRGYVGRPGVFGDRGAANHYDCIARGDVDDERMRVERIKTLTDQWQEETLGKYPRFTVDENESLEDYVARKLDSRLTWAVLAEGCWREPGRMGWWATSDSTDDTEADYDEWYTLFWNEMPPDTYVAVVDVHI